MSKHPASGPQNVASTLTAPLPEETVSQYVDRIEVWWDFDEGDMLVHEWRDKTLNLYFEVTMEGGGTHNSKILGWVEASPFHSGFWFARFRDGTMAFRIPEAEWREKLWRD